MIFTKHTTTELKNTGIYKIICYQTNRVYYGSSGSKTAIHGRLQNHSKLLEKSKHHSWVSQRDYKKYGKENFEFIIVELCIPEECKIREQFYLDISKAGNSELSYNISPTAASNLGTKHSEETRRKYSECRKGKIVSDETRKKMSKASKGRKHSEEAKAKMSAKRKGRKLTPEWVANNVKARKESTKPRKVFTEEERKAISAKMSASLKGRSTYERTDEINEKSRIANSKVEYIITSPEGETWVIKGLKKFCKEHNLRVSNMVNVAKGNYTNHKGWRCYYTNNPTPIKKLKKQYLWKLISPDKEEFILKSLISFCKERNLDPSCFTRVASGYYKQYKGWQASKIEII